MTRHRTLHRFTGTAILGLALLSACSSNTQRNALPSTSIATSTTVVSTTLPPSTTAAPETTAPAPTTTTTTAPLPPPTIPPNVAPNPEPSCVQPSADSEPVELVITDNGVLFEGTAVPTCMGVPESFRFRFTNNAEGDATVAFGDGEAVLAAGDSELSDPLGEMFFVGESFQIGVAELDTVITVLVLPID